LFEEEGEDRVINPSTDTLWAKNPALAWREIEGQTVVIRLVPEVKKEIPVEWF